jgi:hypothetical protein
MEIGGSNTPRGSAHQDKRENSSGKYVLGSCSRQHQLRRAHEDQWQDPSGKGGAYYDGQPRFRTHISRRGSVAAIARVGEYPAHGCGNAVLPTNAPAPTHHTDISFATANVGTLWPAEDATKVSGSVLVGKVQLLIIGIQEGRSAQKKYGPARTMRCMLVPATTWVNTDVRFGIHSSLKFKLHAFEVPSVRITLVSGKIRTVAETVIIVSAHAPCECESDVRKKDDFWALLHGTCQKAMRKNPSALLFVCIDAYARVGLPEDQHIGAAHPDLENDNGARFRTWFVDNGLAAFNT